MPKKNHDGGDDYFRSLDEYTLIPADSFVAGPPFAIEDLGLDEGARAIGVEPALASVVTVLDESRTPLPFGDLVSGGGKAGRGKKQDTCCKDNPQPARATLLNVALVGNSLVLRAQGSHPCGLKSLGLFFATVTYQVVKPAKPPLPAVIRRNLTPVQNSGGGQPFDCPSNVTTRTIQGGFTIAQLNGLGLVGVTFAVVAVAASCCYRPDQGRKGLGYDHSRDKAIV